MTLQSPTHIHVRSRQACKLYPPQKWKLQLSWVKELAMIGAGRHLADCVQSLRCLHEDPVSFCLKQGEAVTAEDRVKLHRQAGAVV